MNRFTAIVAATVLAVTIAAVPIAAQSKFTPSASDAPPAGHAGWIFTPGITYSSSWDDNVLLRGRNEETPDDWLNVVSPRAALNFNGRRDQFDLVYDGSFLRYREFDTLNSYDQFGALSFRHLFSPHLALFARNTTSLAPTTELVQLVGVPFVRTGSTIEDFRGGIEASLARHATLSVSYDFQYTQFEVSDSVLEIVPGLRGGYSHGATAQFRYAVTAHTALTADYDLQHATVSPGDDFFDVQNGSVGVDHQFSEATHAYAAGGIARTGVSSFGPARTGPAWRTGLGHKIRTAVIDVNYARSFVPSYGFGGTLQNEEASVRLHLPLGRRLYMQSSIAWRTNQALIESEPDLHSLWLEGTVGYNFERWLRLEAFYRGDRQTVNGLTGERRNQMGFQIVTANPMRIR